jgi:hypothetical protein
MARLVDVLCDVLAGRCFDGNGFYPANTDTSKKNPSDRITVA